MIAVPVCVRGEVVPNLLESGSIDVMYINILEPLGATQGVMSSTEVGPITHQLEGRRDNSFHPRVSITLSPQWVVKTHPPVGG